MRAFVFFYTYVCYVTLCFSQSNTTNIFLKGSDVDPAVYLHYDEQIDDYHMDTIRVEHRFRQPVVISDHDGRLLGYYNGHQIRNNDGTLAENGDSLGWNNSLKPQFEYNPNIKYNEGFGGFVSAVLVPTDSDSLFVLYHLNKVLVYDVDNFLLPYMLEAGEYEFVRYASSLLKTEIKLNKNGRLEVDEDKKNQIIIEDFLSREVYCVQHANGQDWWVVVGCLASSDAYSILIKNNTEVSIQKYYLSHINTQHINTGWGTTGFSLNGDKLVRLNYRHPVALPLVLETMDFDRCTGKTTNLVVDSFYLPSSRGAYMAAEFSPSGRYLYLGGVYSLCRVDLSKVDYFNQMDTIFNYKDTLLNRVSWTLDSFPHFDFLNLTPNGKIIVFTAIASPFFHLIDNPDADDIQDIGFKEKVYITPESKSPYFDRIIVHEMSRRNANKINAIPCEVNTEDIPYVHKIKVYPVPASQFLYLEEIPRGKAEIIALTSGVVIKNNLVIESPLDISYLESGMYGIRFIETGDIIKFIKI